MARTARRQLEGRHLLLENICGAENPKRALSKMNLKTMEKSLF